jgi:hypothetical protein
MVRRGVAAGAGLIVLLLLVLGFRGCLDARNERALKDYVRDVGALVQESDQQSEALFQLLRDPGDANDVDIQNQLNTFRNQAGQLVDRAAGTDHPDDVNNAHTYLIEVFEFRRDGIAQIAEQLPEAIADQGDRRGGTKQIAAAMQNFLTSDVLYQTRFTPNLNDALKEADIGEKAPESSFLPDVEWLETSVVADRVRSLGGSGASGDAAPGLHGNGLAGVTLGGQTLTPGGSAANVQLANDLKFTIQVANQGENTETDVKVNVTVGRGGDAIKLDKVLDSIAAGETKPVEIPLADQPPTGQNVPISIEIEPVAGEKKTDNNKGTFSAIFTR